MRPRPCHMRISMNSKVTFIFGACAVVLLLASRAPGADKITYDDQLMPLLRNECVSCHNPDKKKAGLDVSSYQALLAGGDGGPVVNVGDPENSPIYQVVAHTKDPYMPKGKGKLADKDIAIFKQWIAGGALENASGKPAVAKNKPKLNLSIVADVHKPRGAAVMPKDLLLEPVVHTQRPGAMLCLASSPWAPLVAIGGQHQVLLYDTETLELVGVLPFPEGQPYVAKFSRNGSMFLVGGGIAAKNGHVVLFDVVSGRRITQIGDEFDAVLAADISPDQSMVALGGPGKTLKIYSTADGQLIKSIKKHTDWVTAIAYSPDGVLLASGDRQGGLWVWEARSGNEFYGLTGHKAAITDVCYRDDSNVLASASEDGTVKAWDMQSGKELKSWNAHGGGVLSVNFAHDGRIVTCGRDKRVRAWKPDGGGLFTTPPFSDLALHATFDGEGKRIVAGDWTGVIRVFDAANARSLGELTADPPSISQRLDAALKQMSEAQAGNEKTASDLAAAQQASYRSSTDLQATNLALSEATNTLDLARSFEQAQKEPDQQKVARDAVAAAQRAASALEKAMPQRTKDAKESLDRLAKIKSLHEQSLEALSQATTRVGKLKAAEFNVQVYAARDELATKQAGWEKLKAAAEDATAASEKANADAAASEKALTEAPGRIRTRQDAITKARDILASAHSSHEAANAALNEKQSLAQQASELAAKLSASAAKNVDDQALNEAATKAAQALDLLTHDVQQARQAIASGADAVAKAQLALDAAQVALTQEQADIESAPKRIASLKQIAQAASEDAITKKKAADEFAASVRAAKANVDRLSAEYRRITQQASVTSSASVKAD